MEVTAIVIVILFFGTGMEPATIHNSAQTNNPVNNEIQVMLKQKINTSNVALEKNMIIANRFVEVKKTSEAIDPYISVNYNSQMQRKILQLKKDVTEEKAVAKNSRSETLWIFM